MELTRKQKDEMFNWHSGNGVLAMKTHLGEISLIEFCVDSRGRIRYTSDQSYLILDLNEFVKNRSETSGHIERR